MREIQGVLGVLITITALGCNSHKGSSAHTHKNEVVHSHGEYSHTHIKKEEVKLNNYFEAYTLNDENFGTKTMVSVNEGKRIMVTNALPNHETGQFPGQGNPNTISAQNKTYVFPVVPKYSGNPIWVREPGVALNGVKFEPGTAEVVKCDTGENYRMEAFQELVNLGLDFNNAHVQPTGAYHYHGSPTSVIETFDTGEDLVHIGFAHDGFPMYFSKSGAYKSSYKLIDGDREGEDCTYETRRNTRDIALGGHHDGTYTSDFEYVSGLGDLDQCNGITVNGKYMYIVTNTFPYVSRCLMGEVSQGQQQRGFRGQGHRPSAAQLFERMDRNRDGKISTIEAKGPLASKFKGVDANHDGFIEMEELNQMEKPIRK